MVRGGALHSKKPTKGTPSRVRINGMKISPLFLAFAILTTRAACAEDGAQHLRDSYEHYGRNFVRALFWLPESSEIFRSHLPDPGQWIGLEPGRWGRLPPAIKDKIFAELGAQLDKLEREPRQNREQQIHDWTTIATQLDAFGFGEEFLARAYDDALTQPAFDWILKRRPEEMGRTAEVVSATFASGELTMFKAVLVEFLMKKSIGERQRFYSRMFAKTASAEDRIRAEIEGRDHVTYVEQGEDATSTFYSFFYTDPALQITRVRSVWNGGAQSKPVVTDFTFEKGVRIKTMNGERSAMPKLARGEDAGELQTTSDYLLAGQTSQRMLEPPAPDKTLTLVQRVQLSNLIGILRSYPESKPIPPQPPQKVEE